MSCPRFDRTQLNIKPLAKRRNYLSIAEIAISPDDPAPPVSDRVQAQIERTAHRILAARKAGKPVILTFGAHLIKNGLAPVVNRMIEKGWITHLATNGAGSIHDWEFAAIGESSEDVRANVARGEFGIWEETGKFLNLAVAIGGVAGLGYGWSVGKMIAEDGLMIPSHESLRTLICNGASQPTPDETLGALSDMLQLVSEFDLPPGWIEIGHAWKEQSVQHAAYSHQVPFTVHPGIGYDIIYTHPVNSGGAIGRGALHDFLSYAESVSRLSGGVHLAVGSAVMAPMIFEKALSMANNLAIQRIGRPIDDHYMVVVDIQEGGDWDWSEGEPPIDNPAYYLRFCKSFYRMGGTLDYICLDNRAFLQNLCQALSAH
ncbi:MAG: hypothetical protein NTU88_14780 [Armatimonadetes bacterium]|nr:hypothetical protein [Armatimonadota bacterium]